jgi:export-related chaperone CsaA
MVTMNEFAALDIRVGKIIEITDLTTRKPMYGLKVDLGTEIGIRNIAAGIAPYYTKEELLNKKVIVIVNLEPKKIADFVSEGMILAAEDSQTITLLQVDKDIEVGGKIR